MAARIRVLRILEYTYDSVETMESDMARWLAGLQTPNGRIRIRSATMPLETVPFEDLPDEPVD